MFLSYIGYMSGKYFTSAGTKALSSLWNSHAYNSSEVSLKLVEELFFFLGDRITNERAETKEKRNAKNRSKSPQRLIGGLELHPVEATETENGDGVGKGCCWGMELVEATMGKPLAINLPTLNSFSPCIDSFGTWFFTERLIFWLLLKSLPFWLLTFVKTEEASSSLGNGCVVSWKKYCFC